MGHAMPSEFRKHKKTFLHRNCDGNTLRPLGVMIDPKPNSSSDKTWDLFNNISPTSYRCSNSQALRITTQPNPSWTSSTRFSNDYLGLWACRAKTHSCVTTLITRLRRDIAVLGFLHRIQLGECHVDFTNLFPRQVHGHAINTRHGKR